METRAIGSLAVSEIGLGCNNFGSRCDRAASRRVIDAAIDCGVTFLDTADIYGGTKSEEFVGEAVAGRRNSVVIATKFGMAVDDERKGAKPAYVLRAVEDSLRRLRTDRIDLYQLHTPDKSTPIRDTLEALDLLVRQGKVREIGCSNFSAEQLAEAAAAVREGAAHFVSVQNEFSLLHREPERGVLPMCAQLDIALIPYFPLACGLLTGKYRKGRSLPEGTRLTKESGRGTALLADQNLETVESLVRFAEARGRSLLELALGWLLSHSKVASVIAGATRPGQVQANAHAGSWRLTADEKTAVDRLVRPAWDVE